MTQRKSSTYTRIYFAMRAIAKKWQAPYDKIPMDLAKDSHALSNLTCEMVIRADEMTTREVATLSQLIRALRHVIAEWETIRFSAEHGTR